MSFQQLFLGSAGEGRITAQAVMVSKTSFDQASAGIAFLADGRQTSSRNESTVVEGLWVTPSSSASEWEVRASLDSGIAPTTGALGVWLALTSDREFELASADPGAVVESFLTFEFRKAGTVPVTDTITGSSLYAQVLEPF